MTMRVSSVGILPSKQARATLDLAINVKDYGASGSSSSTTGGMTAGSKVLTLTAAEDFANGQGILVSGADQLPNPSALTLTQAAGSSSFTATDTVHVVVSLLDASKKQTAVSPDASIAISTAGNDVTTTIDLPDFTAFLNVFAATSSGPLLLATVTCSPNIDAPSGLTVSYSGTASAGLSATQTGKTVTLTISAPASSTGASEPSSNTTVVPLVTTISAGAGTTSLTLADAAGVTVSAADVYHDDTAAIQDAINAIATSEGGSGGTIYVPQGIYQISTALLINSSAFVLRGTYLSAYSGGGPTSGSILRATTGFTAGTPMLVIGASTGTDEPTGVLVDGIELDNNGETSDGLWIRSAGRVTIIRCSSYHPYYHAFFANGGYNSAGIPAITFDTCSVIGGGATQPIYGTDGDTPGVYLMSACFYSSMVNCVCTLPGGSGFGIESGACVSIIGCKVNEISVSGTFDWPFWVQNGDNHTITGCTTFTAASGGCVIMSGVKSGAITGCSFQGVNGANNAGAADNAVIYLQGAVDTVISGNAFTKGTNGVYSIYEDAGNGTPSGNRVVGNTLNGFSGTSHVVPYTGSGLTLANNAGFNPAGYLGTQPSVPASGTAYTNNTGSTIRLFITGGTVTAIAIGSDDTGLTSGTFDLAPGESITLTYSAAPTWKAFGL